MLGLKGRLMELPEEILAHIFSFLPLKDKCNAFLVCKTWSNSFTWPNAWTHTEIRCESGLFVPQMFSDLLPYIRHLKLIVSVTDPEHWETGLWVLQKVLARGEGRLRELCIKCLKDACLLYTGQNLLQELVEILTNGSSLVVLDLRGVPFKLSDSFVKSVAALCPNLQRLFINNSAIICKVVPETIRDVLKSCPALNTIGLFHVSLSHDVLRDLLHPQRTELKLLELRCLGTLHYITPLSDQIWADVRRRHPRLRVDLKLEPSYPDVLFPDVLQPSIPVRQLHLHTWTPLRDKIQVVAQRYAGTLEVLKLQTNASPELNTALIALAKQCTKLREVHCCCPVSQNVIEAFCSLCPDLHRYTLKTLQELYLYWSRLELHPCACTT